MRSRESRYLNGLDKMDRERIKSLPELWQQDFITRFYNILQLENLSKKDICDKVNNAKIRQIGRYYVLNESTLSQYTNFNSNSLRPLPINCLISISHVLDVSVDYLLGLEACEKHDITDIFNATGLSKNSVTILNSNPNIQSFVNYLLQSTQLNEIMLQLNNLFYSEYISSDILSAYSDNLRVIISSSFRKYVAQTLPISREQDSYRKVLIDEFQLLSVQVSEEYICTNVSNDRFLQIRLLAEQEHLSISEAFFNDTVTCIYDILTYMDNSNYYHGLLTHSFSELLDGFLSQQKIQMKEIFTKNIQ